MHRHGRFWPSLWILAVVLCAAAPAARPQGAPALDDAEARFLAKHAHPAGGGDVGDARGRARPQIYEFEAGSGGLHSIGQVWMHMDNTNYSPGNIWWAVSPSLSADPGMQWPGNSGVEYLFYSGLWIAGKDKDGIRRNDEYDELRGELADFAKTRHAYEGIPHGARGADDDADGKVDEDFLNGKDDDGDGLIDEDYGAISPDMWCTEMLDYTPEALSDPTYGEPHVALGLRVQRSSYAWSTPGGSDFVGVHWEITNMTRLLEGVGRAIDSVYVGVYWRPSVGVRTDQNFTQDDLLGYFEVAADGATHPDVLLNDPLRPDRASHEDSILHIFWDCDNNGDDGKVLGAGAVMLLGATRFPFLGFKANLSPDDIANDDYGYAPRHTSVHTYRWFRTSVPYAQGGRPTTDEEWFDAMSNDTKKQLEYPDMDNTGSYRAMFSVGPYLKLPADSTIQLDVAYCVGKCDYTGKAKQLVPTHIDDFTIFREKFGTDVSQSLLLSCQEAWKAWKGTFKANSRYSVDPGKHACGSPKSFTNPGDAGRETCIIGPLGKQIQYRDCQDPEGEYRELSDQHCTWFDMDCDTSTGVCDLFNVPLVDHVTWIGSSPPVPPRTRVIRGDRQVEVQWDDIAEKIPNPGKVSSSGATDILDFQGYRLYRAAGWKRDTETGPNGPSNDLWELVGDWAKGPGAVAGSYVDSVRNPSMPDDSTTWDNTVTCPVHRGAPCHVHQVGFYHYVDRSVLNGFRYFYAVTAYNSTNKPNPVTPLDTVSQQETGRSATDASVVIPRTDCAPDVNHIKVVPNPYRFHAAWDLRGSASDPTGTHVNFNHLPCGNFTLRIFTAAGDLVRTFTQADASGGGTVEWNLVSRNGQDIKGGIYVYSVESDRGHTVGRFIVIR
ncbi:MAG TPA: hypothetical protein VMS93_00810 [Candidatus Saccharimonadales bacterium]|nr:hypothetical protein [Candidatus Saccharimonadales bacterium]